MKQEHGSIGSRDATRLARPHVQFVQRNPCKPYGFNGIFAGVWHEERVTHGAATSRSNDLLGGQTNVGTEVVIVFARGSRYESRRENAGASRHDRSLGG